MARTEQAEAKVTVNGGQAAQELESLRAKAAKLKAEMLELQKTNDKAGFDRVRKQVAETNKEIRRYELALKDIDGLMKRLSGASTKELEQAQRRLVNEIKSAKRETEADTKALAAKQKQLQLVSAELGKHKAQVAAVQAAQKNWFGSMADGFNKYFGMITALGAALTGLVFSFKKLQESSMAFEDAKANLSALTGLEGRQLDYLGQQADVLATTTTKAGVRITKSSTDILDAFTVMGSKRPELLNNAEALSQVTEQALLLAEAGKNELEPSAIALATSMNQFELGADQASRVVNTLAAGSKIGAGEIDYLTEGFVKAGVEMHRANVSIEDGVGLLETLAETGMPAEKAGTSLRNFFLILESGPKETRPSIVGLTGALDELAKKQMDTGQMADLFGRENVTAAAVLIDSRAKVDAYTKAVTGTNIATEQAIKNTSTNSAKLAQARNEFEVTTRVLGDRLAPVMADVTGWGNKFMKMLIALPKFARDNSTLLIALSGAYIALNAAKIKALGTTIAEYAWGQKSIALKIKDQVVLTALIIKEQALAAAQTKTTVAGKLAAGAAGGLRAAFSAMLGPIGAAIIAITALVAAFDWWSKNSPAAIREQKAIADAMDFGKKATDELSKSYEQLSKEVSNFNALSEAERKVLKENIDLTLKKAQANLIELKSRREGAKTAAVENTSSFSVGGYLNSAFSMMTGGGYSGGAKASVADYVERINTNVKEATDGIDELIEKQGEEIKQLQELNTEIEDRVNAETKADAITGKTLSNLEEKARLYSIALKDTVKGSADFLRISTKLANVNKEIGSGGGILDEKAIKAQNTALDELVKKITEANARLAAEAMGVLDRGIAEIRNKYRQDLELAKKYENEKGEIGRKWKQARIDLENLVNTEIENLTQEHNKKLQEGLNQALRDAGMSRKEAYDIDLLTLKEKLDKQAISLKEYYVRIALLDREYAKGIQGDAIAKGEKKNDLLNKYDIGPGVSMESELKGLENDIRSNPQVLTEEEIQLARTKIVEKYAKQRVAAEKTAQEQMLDEMREGAQISNTIVEGLGNFFATTKEAELQAAGDNEEEKKKIQQKYAGIETGIAIAKAYTNMFIGIADVWAKYAATPALAAVFSALLFGQAMGQIALAEQQQNRIQGFAEGLYPVTDQNGTNYNASYAGQAYTQTVSTPSVFLAGEKKPEMIIDGNTMASIRMNEPAIIDAIMKHRFGNYSPSGSAQAAHVQSSTKPVVYTDPALRSLMLKINKQLDDGITTKFVYKDFKLFTDRVADAENTFGL
jgi:TP901 family phage tail tape measure protein